jgi:homoserine dehydrogenase
LFKAVGVDIQFTKHFVERVNDERNIKQITVDELSELFRKTFKMYGTRIPKLGKDAEAVLNDMKTNINLPFVLKWDDKSQELDLVAKTVMRKKNFMTPNKKLVVQ